MANLGLGISAVLSHIEDILVFVIDRNHAMRRED